MLDSDIAEPNRDLLLWLSTILADIAAVTPDKMVRINRLRRYAALDGRLTERVLEFAHTPCATVTNEKKLPATVGGERH